jgi:hypothetical protein
MTDPGETCSLTVIQPMSITPDTVSGSESLVHGRFIQWRASDGVNPPKQPLDLGDRNHLDDDGKYRYMEEVSTDDKAYDSWLTYVGTHIAKSVLRDVTGVSFRLC